MNFDSDKCQASQIGIKKKMENYIMNSLDLHKVNEENDFNVMIFDNLEPRNLSVEVVKQAIFFFLY